ncbi:recombination protein NinG [Massilia aurea]|uniref:recombination protein NinG n=1 Tax=Massilia aurea TaxID=373040 RepID=UPI001C861B40
MPRPCSTGPSARAEALRCISCGRHHTGIRDAGHYRSDGAQPALRFHEDDADKQCVPCNQHKGGNAIEYRIALRTRIATSGSSSWSAGTRRRSTRLRTPSILGRRRALGQPEYEDTCEVVEFASRAGRCRLDRGHEEARGR